MCEFVCMKANLYVHVAVTGQPQVTFLILHSSFVFDIESLIGSVHTYAARLTNLPSEGSLASSVLRVHTYMLHQTCFVWLFHMSSGG